MMSEEERSSLGLVYSIKLEILSWQESDFFFGSSLAIAGVEKYGFRKKEVALSSVELLLR